MTNTAVPYMNFMLSKYFTYQNVNVDKHKKIFQQRNTSNYYYYYFFYIYITPVNNLPLVARKPQRFTNIYNEQYN